jgi:hypothetical protein
MLVSLFAPMIDESDGGVDGSLPCSCNRADCMIASNCCTAASMLVPPPEPAVPPTLLALCVVPAQGPVPVFPALDPPDACIGKGQKGF